ncbi:MAG TPA: sigma 54-interacting transcriptional regulator [Kofleriaceae bacterium]|nr:sigma 54-interacting transcriptional regulator [Kofleriaceae bacterium]
MSWAHGGPGRGGGHAGLILLYTPSYSQLPAGYVLRGDAMVIGRDDHADLCVPSRAISRQHARLSRQGDRWVLADLGGRNGTIVNGELIGEAGGEVVLEHHDEIHIGDAIWKFVEDDAPGYLRHRIDGAPGRIIGGYQIQRLAAELGKVAASDLSVLILGESGTGKEVFAQELHERSGRSGPLQAVNCAAIPATLIEAELFGHRRGAFSGADRDRPGLIRAANGGTLFLDEIGDMPLEAQAKLLRVLQSKEVLPIGASQAERVDVRIVCATHRDLRKLQGDERFRGDLFARLNEYSLKLPALRERKEDCFALCRAFAARHGRPDALVSFPFMTGVLHYDFPYNVRELEALIKRWAAVASGPELGAEHLTDEIKELMKTYGLPRAAGAERPAPRPSAAVPPAESPRQSGPPSEQSLRELLTRHQGNIAAVGRELGKDRVQVHRWLRRYGIDVSEYRPPDG